MTWYYWLGLGVMAGLFVLVVYVARLLGHTIAEYDAEDRKRQLGGTNE